MKRFFIVGGLLFVAMGTIPLKHHIAEYDTQRNGEMVKGRIAGVPNCGGTTKTKRYIKFRFENEIYSKRTTGKPCREFKLGDSIVLKHTKGTDIFLYDTETVESELISFGILILTGISFIIVGVKKSRR